MCMCMSFEQATACSIDVTHLQYEKEVHIHRGEPERGGHDRRDGRAPKRGWPADKVRISVHQCVDMEVRVVSTCGLTENQRTHTHTHTHTQHTVLSNIVVVAQ